MIWTSIENTCSQLVKNIHPTISRVIAFQNGPETQTPYCVINVKNHDSVTREEIGTFVEQHDGNDVLVVKEVYECTVSFAFVGDDASSIHAGNLLDTFTLRLSHPSTTQWLTENGLSYLRKGVARKVPKLRETKWYGSYEIDVQFAYYVESTQPVEYINSIGIDTAISTPIETTNESVVITRGDLL